MSLKGLDSARGDLPLNHWESVMNKLFATATAVATLFASQFAFAQATPATPATPASPAVAKQPDDLKPAVVKPEDKLKPQQQKMKDCNAAASEKKLKGDERKAFMSNCLKKKK
jgi:hypothetical protein